MNLHTNLTILRRFWGAADLGVGAGSIAEMSGNKRLTFPQAVAKAPPGCQSGMATAMPSLAIFRSLRRGRLGR